MIKERIIQVIEKKGIAKELFYKKIGVSSANFRGDAKKTPLNSNTIENVLSEIPDISPAWLLTGRGEMLIPEKKYKETPIPVLGVAESEEVYKSNHKVGYTPLNTDKAMSKIYAEQRVPLYEISAQAGVVGLFVDAASQTPVDYISIPNLSKCDGAVHVRGDSMYPILKSGDIVLYKKVNNISTGISYGDMYIVDCDVDGDTIIAIKYVQRGDSPEMVRLASYNQHYSSVDVPIESIRSLAIVKASIRYNTMG